MRLEIVLLDARYAYRPLILHHFDVAGGIALACGVALYGRKLIDVGDVHYGNEMLALL